MADGNESEEAARKEKLTEGLESFLSKCETTQVQDLRLKLIDDLAELCRQVHSGEVSEEQLKENHRRLVRDYDHLIDEENLETKGLTRDEFDKYSIHFDKEMQNIKKLNDEIKGILLDKYDSGVRASRKEMLDRLNQENADASQEEDDGEDFEQTLIDEKSNQIRLEAEKDRIIKLADINRKKRQLEEERIELNNQAELLKLEVDLKVSKTRVQLLEDLDDRRSRVSSASRRSHQSVSSRRGRLSKHNSRNSSRNNSRSPSVCSHASHRSGITPTPRMSLADSRGLDALMNKLADVVIRPQRQTVQIEPRVFDGNVLEYPMWRRMFEELIEDEIKPERRIIYILKYTSGKAHKCISSLQHLTTEAAYREAVRTY